MMRGVQYPACTDADEQDAVHESLGS
jgi:hypothetical protein